MVTPGGTCVEPMITILHQFAATPCDASSSFFGIPTWYQYLASHTNPTLMNGSCQLVTTGDPGTFVTIIYLVGLALIDIALRIVGLVSVVFVIVGGIKYVTSQGEPSKTKGAQQTILNALIGAAIAILASAIVSFIGNSV